MSKHNKPDGCLFAVAAASIGLACGCQWGPAVGWLAMGGLCLLVFLIGLVR